MSLNEAIRSIVKPLIKSQLITGKVTQFFADDYTCEVEFDKRLKLDQVKLKSVLNSEESGIYVKPKIGSTVIVCLIENKLENLFIVGFSEIDEIFFKTPLLKLNGDSNGGLLVEEKLVNELKKVNQILQSISTVLNGTPIPEAGNGAASSLQVALRSAIAGKTLPTYQEITNSTVKHG